LRRQDAVRRGVAAEDRRPQENLRPRPRLLGVASTDRARGGVGGPDTQDETEQAMNPLIEAFERSEVESFHHRDHVRMAWSYLREFGFAEGARRFTDANQRFATAHGKPNLYHATITWAYLVLINERMEQSAPH